MAKHNELRLLWKVAYERDISKLIDSGVQDDWFFDDYYKQAWKFVLKHYAKYSEVPTAVTILDNFPNLGEPFIVEDTVDYLIDAQLEYRKHQKTLQALIDANEKIAVRDANGAIEVLGKAVQAILNENTRDSNDENLSENPMQRFDEYQAIKTRPNGLLGISTGFKTIDEITHGVLKQQLWTIAAPPKTGKSVLAMQMALRAQDENMRILFQSYEMTADEMKRRYDAMRAHIAYSRLLTGGLHPKEEADFIASLKVERSDFWMPDNIATRTVTGLCAKIEKFEPEIVFVDGMYLMHDEDTGEKETERSLRSLTRNMKQVAQRYDIPVIVSTQTLESKRRGGKVTANSIGYTSSFLQDSDIVLVLQRQDEEDDTSRSLTIAASRISGMGSADLLWDWEEGRFEEFAAFNNIKSI
jgi:replicative DNA helicase